jgi:hypothetical protein
MGHQMAMASKVLKSDIETILSSRQARDDGDAPQATNPRKTEAIGHWLGRATDKASAVGGAVIGVVTGLPTTATGAFPPGCRCLSGSVHRSDGGRRHAEGIHQRRKGPTRWL